MRTTARQIGVKANQQRPWLPHTAHFLPRRPWATGLFRKEFTSSPRLACGLGVGQNLARRYRENVLPEGGKRQSQARLGKLAARR